MKRRLFLLSGSPLLLAACGRRTQAGATALPAGATVLALGDSITFGTGSTPEASYLSVLARVSGWKVVNAGVPGDVSAGALQRLPDLLKEHSPQLVLVSIGGNDMLRQVPFADTRANVRRICEQAAASGAQVVLIGIPQPSALAAVARSLSDHVMYEELAAELKIPLHGGGWAKVLSDPALRSDQIHANQQGYEQFAQGLAQTLRAAGLLG